MSCGVPMCGESGLCEACRKKAETLDDYSKREWRLMRERDAALTRAEDAEQKLSEFDTRWLEVAEGASDVRGKLQAILMARGETHPACVFHNYVHYTRQLALEDSRKIAHDKAVELIVWLRELEEDSNIDKDEMAEAFEEIRDELQSLVPPTPLERETPKVEKLASDTPLGDMSIEELEAEVARRQALSLRNTFIEILDETRRKLDAAGASPATQFVLFKLREQGFT